MYLNFFPNENTIINPRFYHPLVYDMGAKGYGFKVFYR
jgi:hypothetical protein